MGASGNFPWGAFFSAEVSQNPLYCVFLVILFKKSTKIHTIFCKKNVTFLCQCGIISIVKLLIEGLGIRWFSVLL